MKSKESKSQVTVPSTPANGGSPEADFNDTIAHNRGLKLLDPGIVPHAPAGYRPTDPDVRFRRLRRIAGDLRSEAGDALREAGGRDLQGELGRFAPDSRRAVTIAERLSLTAELVARAQSLVEYAREMDQISLSDALVFLESEHKQYENAVEHDASLVPHYRAMVKLFEARSGAIAEGIARAKSAEDAQAPAAPPVQAPAGLKLTPVGPDAVIAQPQIATK